MNRFEILLADELRRTNAKHGPITNLHQGLGLLLEEYKEFEEIVFQKEGVRDGEHLLRELVQVANVAQRIAEAIAIPLADAQSWRRNEELNRLLAPNGND